MNRLIAETGVKPAVNQIDMHPFFTRVNLREHRRGLGKLTEAWSPLGRGNELLGDPVIEAIARDHRVTAAQVVLRSHVHSGAIPLPKAASVNRQLENLDLFGFDLNSILMATMTQLGRVEGRTFGQVPASHVEF